MPNIQSNRLYNDPALGVAFSNLAAAFAPPNGSDVAGYAAAQEKRLQAQALQNAISVFNDPSASVEARDNAAAIAKLYGPTQGFGARNMESADRRYGSDQTLAGVKYSTDTKAKTDLETTRMTNTKDISTSLLAPVAAGATRFVPPSIADMYGLPETQMGAITAGQGDTVVTPDGRTIAGTPKPPTEEQIKGAILQGLPQSDQRNAVLSGVNVEQVIGPDGKPFYVNRTDAAGQRAYNSGPSTVINNGPNGVPYGEPEKGLVWVRNPDGTIKLDERGAPKAIPYEGGSVYKQQQDDAKAANAKDNSASTKRDIVVQDLDRALTSIGQNPALTTGVGAQLTGGVGGMPARDVQALLNTVRANVGFEQLQQMRDSSPTGGALGQVTEKEQELLQSVLGSLDTSQSAEQLTANLKRLKNTYLDIIHGAGKGPAREDVGFGGDKPSREDAETYAVNPQNGQRLVLRNGAWEPVK